MATLTKDKLYEKGFEALKKELGLNGAIRFVSTLRPWDGLDSVKTSQDFAKNFTFDEIVNKAKKHQEKKPKK